MPNEKPGPKRKEEYQCKCCETATKHKTSGSLAVHTHRMKNKVEKQIKHRPFPLTKQIAELRKDLKHERDERIKT